MERAEHPTIAVIQHTLSPDAQVLGIVVLLEDRHDLSPKSFCHPLLLISLDVGKDVLRGASRGNKTWHGHSPGTCPSATAGGLPILEVDLLALPGAGP